MTHAELVQRAARWLKGAYLRCCFIVAEPQGHGFSEWPDAIGWDYKGASAVVECKASISDFYADRRKKGRSIFGMGDYRYYLTPPKLIDPERHKMPEGWGLAECHKRTIRIVREAPLRRHSCFKRAETAILIQQCRTDFEIAAHKRDGAEKEGSPTK